MAYPPPSAGTALITGVTGQDGQYLAPLLHAFGFTVHGTVRPGSPPGRTPPGVPVVEHRVDLENRHAVLRLIESIDPQYVFHLAGVTSVAASWSDPVSTLNFNASSTTALLDACLRVQDEQGSPIVVVNASSAEIFSGAASSPQSEATPIEPTSPYGASKALGHMMCVIYRSRGLAASNAILYNHESPLRPTHFVTRKITAAVARIARGLQDSLTLGDLQTRRDWGWAPDYVDALYRIALQGVGDDFVIATGISHSIGDFVAAAFAEVGIDDWHSFVQTDATLRRPTDPVEMVGDSLYARRVLGWQPSVDFTDMVAAMVRHDLDEIAMPQHAVGGDL
ncbi:GDP-mannose 4,6-dehydratase [Mycolicibacterium anyangense]|uniref:GDP-mannose 4,6-dehydratase n=1 Tax=Mycolicibacterium anyangense TaxID=1431246 RepID=A0A6N4W3P0_9MYCO|nr:GDP-mannose 4,6-dehydratase [Mycolicibacterium anyangense]BBZ75188.1 GDP-mannose 4,6-dehydratase [Mycolicibacterium anyangense]